MTIVLVDDHPLVRAGVRALLESYTDLEIVGEADGGAEACELASRMLPDVVVLDLSMPGMSGTETTASLRKASATVKIVVLSVHEEPSYVIRSMRAGAHAYVLKRSASSTLVDAVRAVAAGGSYVDPAMTHALVEDVVARGTAPPEEVALSPRERDVLIRIARGFTSREIAAELAISAKTVETYKARFASKASLRSRVDIVRYAARHGWLATP